MDKDQLLQRWVPIGSIREGPVPSYEAKGPDGRFVQVHRISSKDPDFQRLSALIKRVVPHPPPDLVEIGEFDGGMAVVTHILPSQMGLEDWLNDALGGGEGPPEVAEAPDVAEAPEVTEAPEAAGQEDADYSAYFRIPPGTDSGGVPEAAQEGAPESEEESYTSIFQASPEPSEPGPTPAEPVPAAMEPEPGPAPAERGACFAAPSGRTTPRAPSTAGGSSVRR